MGCALATHLGSFSATSESSIVSGCSPLRMGADSHGRYDAAIAAVEGHARF